MPGETSMRTEEIGPVRSRVEKSRPSAGLTAGEEAASSGSLGSDRVTVPASTR